MEFVIVTGMSGAGKSSVLKMLEDDGFFCVDNLPIPLLLEFVQLKKREEEHISKVAVGIDIRSGQHLMQLEAILEQVPHYKILFLDCRTDVLVKRYQETRRSHPLSGVGRLDKAIELERQKLSFLKKRSDHQIDTSCFSIRELKKEVIKILQEQIERPFFITILSFGFRYGIPLDSDFVFDARFLPNPYYIPELCMLTGNDPPVFHYVLSKEVARQFLDHLYKLMVHLLPSYQTEGKNQLLVGIGCTGGRHRSVALANALAQKLQDLKYSVQVEHRDIAR